MTNLQEEIHMHRVRSPIIAVVFLIAALAAVGQQSPSQPGTPGDNTQPSGTTTVRGCLRGSRGNYLVIEDKTGLVYVLKGVGNKLDNQLRHQVEVNGKILPGTIKTGTLPEKAGSNPSDTVHGVDGVPLQVADVKADVRTISNHCK